MREMTGWERVTNTLNRKPVDQVPCYEHLWPETHDAWKNAGVIQDPGGHIDWLKLDLSGGGWFKSVADIDFVPVVLEETEDTILTLDGNGAKLRRHKKHSSTPEHVGYLVEDRDGWEKRIKPFITQLERRRIDFDAFRKDRDRARAAQRYFVWNFIGPFEQIHPVCGHENMLMGMIEDPEWIREMAMEFVEFSIRHAELLFAEVGEPDGVWFYEDMGYKQKPFMSPDHYRELIQPAHKRLFDWAHARGKKVIVHSCGFVEPLIPGMIEAGMDCLQAIEVKAGMDLAHLADRFGDRIAFCGGFDIREMISNDRDRIDRELGRTLGHVLARNVPYILHSDHSVPPEVKPETLAYFIERGREMSRKPAYA